MAAQGLGTTGETNPLLSFNVNLSSQEEEDVGELGENGSALNCSFQCPLCNYTANSSASLARHNGAVHKGGSVRTVTSSQGTRVLWRDTEETDTRGSGSNVTTAIMMRDKRATYTCADSNCDQRSKVKRSILEHLEMEHLPAQFRVEEGKVGPDGRYWIRKNLRYLCSQCDLTIKSHPDLVLHMTKEHGDAIILQKELPCDNCALVSTPRHPEVSTWRCTKPRAAWGFTWRLASPASHVESSWSSRASAEATLRSSTLRKTQGWKVCATNVELLPHTLKTLKITPKLAQMHYVWQKWQRSWESEKTRWEHSLPW